MPAAIKIAAPKNINNVLVSLITLSLS